LFRSVLFDQLHWAELADRFSERLVWRHHRSGIDLWSTHLRHQVDVLATSIRENTRIDIAEAKRSRSFGSSGRWGQGTNYWSFEYLSVAKLILRVAQKWSSQVRRGCSWRFASQGDRAKGW
jgi:hypothetical protein